jgi:hypothetical protein
LLMHNGARLHLAYATQEKFKEVKVELLDHLSRSLDPAPSSFQLFWSTEWPCWWQTFPSNSEVEHEGWLWLK